MLCPESCDAASRPRRADPRAAGLAVRIAAARRALCDHFGTRDLAGFGVEDATLAIAAAGALLEYARRRSSGACPRARARPSKSRATYLAPRRRDPAQPRDHRNAARRAGADAAFRCSTPAPQRPAAACCATGCTIRCARRARPPPATTRSPPGSTIRAARERCAGTRGTADVERIAGAHRAARRAAARPRRPARHAGAACRRSGARWPQRRRR